MTPSLLDRFVKISMIVFFFAAAVEANAEGFDEHDLFGDYAFTFDGSAGGVPVAAAGRFFADGKGNLLDASRILVLNGLSIPQSFTCTYVVHPDGRGAADCKVVGANPESFSFVIFRHGRQAYFVGTTPGVTIHGNAI